MAGFNGRGALVTRWLPMTSVAMIIPLGVGILLHALAAAGVLPVGPSWEFTSRYEERAPRQPLHSADYRLSRERGGIGRIW
jgi:hypothetical protein